MCTFCAYGRGRASLKLFKVFRLWFKRSRAPTPSLFACGTMCLQETAVCKYYYGHHTLSSYTRGYRHTELSPKYGVVITAVALYTGTHDRRHKEASRVFSARVRIMLITSPSSFETSCARMSHRRICPPKSRVSFSRHYFEWQNTINNSVEII